jgi:hypothetical protein
MHFIGRHRKRHGGRPLDGDEKSKSCPHVPLALEMDFASLQFDEHSGHILHESSSFAPGIDEHH